MQFIRNVKWLETSGIVKWNNQSKQINEINRYKPRNGIKQHNRENIKKFFKTKRKKYRVYKLKVSKTCFLKKITKWAKVAK